MVPPYSRTCDRRFWFFLLLMAKHESLSLFCCVAIVHLATILWAVNDISLCKVRQLGKPASTSTLFLRNLTAAFHRLHTIWVFHEILSKFLALFTLLLPLK